MRRTITELIWHCTATPAGREVSVDEIRSWHLERGFRDIGYHRIVHLDGSVSEGRPDSHVGAHVQGRNRQTLGYVYVGGLDADGRPADTRTPEQRAAMRRLTAEAVERYGLTLVSGHRDYASKECPCFDARAEYADLLPRKIAIVSASALNVRAEPGGDLLDWGPLPRGTRVRVIGSDGEWQYVSYGGRRGFVHGAYLEPAA
jgi:hypothetical protein